MDEADEDMQRIATGLLAYLRRRLPDDSLAYAHPLTRLRGGYDTRIYRFRLSGAPPELSGDLVLRLYPRGRVADDALWESRVQTALAASGHPVAQPRPTCTDPSVLGGAFFLMDFLPGNQLLAAPIDTMPVLLGEAHAALHRSDPQPVVASLAQAPEDSAHHRLIRPDDVEQALLADDVSWADAPGARRALEWLAGHRPPQARSVLCHGDLHPLNVLFRERAVTGLLDWGQIRLADPAWDLARTLLVLTLPYRYLVAPSRGEPLASVDWDAFAATYLDAYCVHNPEGTANLDDYLRRGRVLSWIDGTRGHPVWRYPPIAEDLMSKSGIA